MRDGDDPLVFERAVKKLLEEDREEYERWLEASGGADILWEGAARCADSAADMWFAQAAEAKAKAEHARALAQQTRAKKRGSTAGMATTTTTANANVTATGSAYMPPKGH
ncbi:unnamed protein product [Vitrella brassicaformis CCMP3155]|uniref:Uncharacterized protein n=1 Tax=Vitrella brassicaformis (strain CCMP3155) TaxID=1169540 RepID=A0A0G4EKJ3_VITBC|nr:unnamed protein product [Vitrella brassicaformis CCMP3155]|eukprot:CEL97641.1 unnamed protein product [Vitrella brassicaformis CCMP3155]